jgi:hypothetical protein
MLLKLNLKLMLKCIEGLNVIFDNNLKSSKIASVDLQLLKMVVKNLEDAVPLCCE